MMGPAFDFALLKLFYASPHDQNTSSTTHPPELSRILQSYESLKSSHSSNESVSECLAKLVDHFAGFEGHLTSFTKSSDDAFSEQLAETIHNATGLSSPYDDSHLPKIWSLVSAELNAFRPPFESVNSEVPELISPTVEFVGAIG